MDFFWNRSIRPHRATRGSPLTPAAGHHSPTSLPPPSPEEVVLRWTAAAGRPSRFRFRFRFFQPEQTSRIPWIRSDLNSSRPAGHGRCKFLAACCVHVHQWIDASSLTCMWHSLLLQPRACSSDVDRKAREQRQQHRKATPDHEAGDTDQCIWIVRSAT